MVSKYSLLFDVKFQSMFPLRQKKDAAVIATALLSDDRHPLRKENASDAQALSPIKE